MQKFYDCGIDLGTTNSCIAVATNDNSYVIIENVQDRMQVTPSAVSVDKRGKILIGQRALYYGHTQDLATQFKRDIGTTRIKKFKSSGIEMTPEVLSAEVLKTLKSSAEMRLSEKVIDAVITVPAAFSTVQCEATNEAAKLAGFRNVILLQEPIAAAIAYGAKPDSNDQYWMVFDFGGGTLDVAIVSTFQGRLTVINHEGDNYYGGCDMDRLIFEKLIKPKLQSEYSIENLLRNGLEKKILNQAEEIKIQLSSAESVTYEIFEEFDDNNKAIEFECEIHRDEFENTIKEVVDRCIRIAKKALEGAKIKESQLNKILLVGGSTFIPLVRNTLKESFNVELDCSINPMTVVAAGAAIYASTCKIENDIDNSGSIDPEKKAVALQYEPITSESIVNVIGKIQGNDISHVSKVKIDSVRSRDNSNALWTSGWVEFLSEGIFDIDVKIFEGKLNTFKVNICDNTGKNLELENNVFEIRHNENALKTSAPPVNFSVSVMFAEDNYNKLKPLIKKNTYLPAEGTEAFFTTKKLDPSVDDSIHICIWEGENFENPKANRNVGTIIINSSAIDRVVPKGSEMLITIAQDESRNIKVTGFITDLEYEIPSETLRGRTRNDYKELLDNIQASILEIEVSINVLEDTDIGISSIKQEFERLKEEYAEAYEFINVDNSKVENFMRRFFEFQTVIIELEKSSIKKYRNLKDDEKIKWNEDEVERYGKDDEKRRFKELKESITNADDDESREFYKEKMENLMNDVVLNRLEDFDWLQLVFRTHLAYLTKEYTNPQKAEYWKSQAYEGIDKGNTSQLRDAVINLIMLKFKTADDSVNSKIADLTL